MDMDLDDAHVAGNTDNDNPDLSYETEQEKALRIGKAANPLTIMRPSGGINEATPSCDIHEDDIINVQLPYNPDAPTEPELSRSLTVDFILFFTFIFYFTFLFFFF